MTIHWWIGGILLALSPIANLSIPGNPMFSVGLGLVLNGTGTAWLRLAMGWEKKYTEVLTIQGGIFVCFGFVVLILSS